MKAITATVSFTIKNRFYKEDLDEQLESYKEEIEALLDYDCDVYNPIKEEDTDECVSFSFPVDAYVEIIDEKDQIEGEEKIKEDRSTRNCRLPVSFSVWWMSIQMMPETTWNCFIMHMEIRFMCLTIISHFLSG